MNQNIIIKNMVCPRCIAAVQQVFQDLKITVASIDLGSVITIEKIDADQKQKLKRNLAALGFELLDDKESQLINEIKSTIIQEIHYEDEAPIVNYSTLLSKKLHYDYAYLSRLFSSVEGRTIEKFIIVQKIEKVKELLTYKELTISEIAFQMNYSSTAHLSTQFKKITGMPPSEFKKMQKQGRQFIDDI